MGRDPPAPGGMALIEGSYDFRAGVGFPGSPMPWGAFARMADDDLRAVYRYLMSLDPVHHEVGPGIQPAAGR